MLSNENIMLFVRLLYVDYFKYKYQHFQFPFTLHPSEFIVLNAPLPFPFLYRRSEARSSPSPKYWAACTHIRGCTVLSLVAATGKKIGRNQVVNVCSLYFISRLRKRKTPGGNKRNGVFLVEVALHLRKHNTLTIFSLFSLFLSLFI